MTVRYESDQDFATKMACIATITMGGDEGWKYENFRSFCNDNDARFRHHLHEAMGWKASTVEDWNG